MSIQNLFQNAMILKDKKDSLLKQKTGNLAGYVTTTVDGKETVTAKPSYDLTVEQPYEQSERAYEAAADKNPYSLENMVGGWVDDIKGGISEMGMLFFGSDEAICKENTLEKVLAKMKQEKQQEEAQKEQDEANYEKFKDAKQDMNYAELQRKLHKWTYDNELKEFNNGQ